MAAMTRTHREIQYLIRLLNRIFPPEGPDPATVVELS